MQVSGQDFAIDLESTSDNSQSHFSRRAAIGRKHASPHRERTSALEKAVVENGNPRGSSVPKADLHPKPNGEVSTRSFRLFSWFCRYSKVLASMIEIFGPLVSPFVIKLLAAADYKGLDYS